MPKQFFYSINLLIKSDSHLEKAIASIVADEAYFLENVQLILIDSLCSKLSLNICSQYNKKYPENIYFVDAAGKNEAAAYNDARPLCSGTYMTYTDNYGEYSKKMLRLLQEKYLRKARIPILCVQPIVSPPGEEPHEYLEELSTGIIKLKETPERFIPMLGCAFFLRSLTNKLLFDETLRFQADVKYIAEALLQTYSYIFTDEFHYTTTLPSDHEWFKYLPQYSKAFYSAAVEELMLPLLIGYPGSVLAQSIVMYLLESRFALNENERYKHVLIGNFVDDFFNKASRLLQYIDDAVILNTDICRLSGLDEEMAFRLLRLKYKMPDLKPEIDLVLPKDHEEKSYFNHCGRLEKRNLNGEFVAHHNQAVVGDSHHISASIEAVNFDSDGLYIDAILQHCSFMESKDFRLFVNVNGERTAVIPSEVYTLKKYFDVPFLRRSSFRFFVPVSSGKNMDTVYLVMKYQNMTFRIDMSFDGIFARLSSKVQSSYWSFLDRLMTYDRKTKCIVIRRATSSLLRLCESKFMSEAGRFVSMAEALHYRQLRKSVRNMLQEKGSARYLLFYDESGAHHNGHTLFTYFARHLSADKTEVFYAAKRGTEEFDLLQESESPGLLETGSKKAKLTTLCADLIFATDCDVYESLMFTKKDILFLKDLFGAKIISVKDFFITYASAQFDNRLRDNTQLFFCASEKEKERLTKGVYDYDASMIRVTGYPILDTLTDEKEKLILLLPGDRRQFCIYENSDFYRFSESRFFKAYNDLLTDPRLHEALKEQGYRIAVMMPEAVEKYLQLFHSDEAVQLYSHTEENETEMVRKAAVLITDHSDLQYRFAYLNKPIVYYFPPNLQVPQEYKNEGLAKNSFGKMFFEHDPLVEHLAAEIRSGFVQPEHYANMCNSFFKYHDTHNCRRIFTLVKNTFLSEPSGNNQ